MRLPTAKRDEITDFSVDACDVGSTRTEATLRLYDDTSRTTLLAEIPLNQPAYHDSGAQGGLGAGLQPATDGRAWMDINTGQPEDPTPAAAGDAVFADIIDRDLVVQFEGSVGIVASGEFVEISSIGIQTTVPVKIENAAITTPAGSL